MAAVIALAVACICIGGVNYLHIRAEQEAEARWALERRELLNRIQRPELVPSRPIMQFDFPDNEHDESGLVGTIHYEPED